MAVGDGLSLSEPRKNHPEYPSPPLCSWLLPSPARICALLGSLVSWAELRWAWVRGLACDLPGAEGQNGVRKGSLHFPVTSTNSPQSDIFRPANTYKNNGINLHWGLILSRTFSYILFQMHCSLPPFQSEVLLSAPFYR